MKTEPKFKGNEKDWSLTLNNYTDLEKKVFKRWASEVKLMVISKEIGETGTKHLQGRIIFTRTYTMKALKKLFPRVHWEMTKCRSDSLYLLKADSRKFIDVDNRKQGHRTDLDTVIKDVRAGATKKKLWESHPNAMLRYHKGFYEAMKFIAPIEEHIIDFSLDDFGWEPLDDWTKMNIIIGKSGIGKTEFARAHFKHPLIVSHMDDLGDLREEHDGIIFDDVDFKHIPRTAQIHLCDVGMTRSIHIRYTTATIPKGMPRIVTCNRMPFDISDKAISRRCLITKLKAEIRTEVRER